MFKNFTHLSQFGLSLILPIVFFVLSAEYLKENYGFGNWISLIAIILGLLTCIPTVKRFVGYMLSEAKKSEDNRKI